MAHPVLAIKDALHNRDDSLMALWRLQYRGGFIVRRDNIRE